ncbi:MAG: gfo/Idh/MocA family oxidoreductase [Verrucomicrobia bacterium]|nr:MAG: gfo/Idh/MocA family oxidoreductase [Verrucomicrobiota bacterium]
MRIAVIGLGVQGRKRRTIAGNDVVAVVDPVAAGVDYQLVEDVPLESYEAACVCVPDQEKFAILRHLLAHGKHALVEKPLLGSPAQIGELLELCGAQRATCYTAYNHRFEPHIARLKEVLASGSLGQIYFAKFFYGNGTARDVRNSPWRDKELGVFSDLGSHMLDMAHFLFGPHAEAGELWSADRFENKAPDHVLFGYRGKPVLEMEATLLSWRNTFRLDLFGELGSAHINCLCKWGPSTLTVRERILPSGRPRESVEVLEQPDPTWQVEYDHFLELCRTGGTNLENDIWIHEKIREIGQLIEQVSP